MGTSKRERQKANRARRQLEEAQQVQTDRRKRTILQWGLGIAAAFAGVVLIAWLGGAFGSGEDDTIVTGDAVSSDEISTDEPDDATAAADEAAADDEAGTDAPTATEAPDSSDAESAAVADGECPPADGAAEQTQQFDAYPPMCIDEGGSYTAEIVTNQGPITVELYADRAPLTVNSFVTLARHQYFNDTVCHRIIENFVIQCGDPTATGTGGPGYQYADELPDAGEYEIGSLAMANSGPNTNGSQFFIITGDDGASLPPSYSLFGKVTEGLDIADQIQRVETDPSDRPLDDVVIESVTITES